MSINVPETSLAVLGAALATSSIKLLDLWLRQRRDANALADTAAKDIRADLRQELEGCRTRMASVQSELDQWKERYYRAQEHHVAQMAEIDALKLEVVRLRGDP